MSLANARFTCSEMDESKTVAALRRSRFLVFQEKYKNGIYTEKKGELCHEKEKFSASFVAACDTGA